MYIWAYKFVVYKLHILAIHTHTAVLQSLAR